MSVAAASSYVDTHTANGLTDTFAYNFKILHEDDLGVYVDDELQASGYSVEGVGDAQGQVVFTVNPVDDAVVTLALEPVLARVDDYGASAEVELAAGAASDALLLALMNAGVGISRFEVVEPSLQSSFIAKVGMDAATAPAREDGAHA